MIQENNWNEYNLTNDLIITKNILFSNALFNCSQPIPELESNEYSAHRFEINQLKICYRIAKVTPTKTGLFVTLWKRNENRIIEPFDLLDEIDAVIVSVRGKEKELGQFIFPKNILLEKGVFSTNNKEGKRAIRVYPPWSEVSSKQALQTQKWQLHYFFEVIPEKAKLISDFLRDKVEKT